MRRCVTMIPLLVISYTGLLLSQEDLGLHRAERSGRKDDQPASSLEEWEKWEKGVRSASSLEELLKLTDFPDWKLWKCRLKLKDLELVTHPEHRSSSVGPHRSTRYATRLISLDILKAVSDEYHKTQCMPRETCVDLAQEADTNNGRFFKPPCVSVYRCGGCCNKDGVTCRKTSSTQVNKTVLTVIPFKYNLEPVLLQVDNHTECKCLEPAVIRRHAPSPRPSGCNPFLQSSDPEGFSRLCARGLIWDCQENRCVPYPSSKNEFPPNPRLSDCEIDADHCICLAKNSTKSRQPCKSTNACIRKSKHSNRQNAAGNSASGN